MKQRVFFLASLPFAALILSAGCAEILGLEPPIGDTGGSAGTSQSTSTTTTGGGGTGGSTSSGGTAGTAGTAGSAGCIGDSDCPAGGLPPCTKPVCNDGKCDSAPAQDGESVPCYDGPAGTEGVGVCHAGTQICTNGIPTGPCNGSSLPADKEDCNTPEDDNCNGAGDDCPGTILSINAFLGGGANDVRGVEIGPDNEIYLIGNYSALMSMGGCSLDAPPGNAAKGAYLVRLQPDLSCAWAATLSDTSNTLQLADLVVAQNRVWAVGIAAGTATIRDAVPSLQTTPVTSNQDGFLVAFDKDTGHLFDAFLVGGVANDIGTSIAAGDNVHAVFQGGTGIATGVKSGDMAQYVAQDNADIVVVTLDATSGKLYWTKTYGSPGGDSPRGAAVSNGRLYLGGAISSGTAASVSPACLAHQSAFVKGFVFDVDANDGVPTPQLCHLWTGAQGAQGTSVAAQDTLVVSAGYSIGLTDLGCGSPGGSDIPSKNGWYRAVDIPDACTNSALLPGSPDVVGVHAEILGKTVVLGGNYTGTLYGAASQGGQDIFVARYPDSGTDPLWSLKTGSSGDDGFSDLAVSPLDGTIYAVGTCTGQAFAFKADCDIQGDGFLLRISP